MSAARDSGSCQHVHAASAEPQQTRVSGACLSVCLPVNECITYHDSTNTHRKHNKPAEITIMATNIVLDTTMVQFPPSIPHARSPTANTSPGQHLHRALRRPRPQGAPTKPPSPSVPHNPTSASNILPKQTCRNFEGLVKRGYYNNCPVRTTTTPPSYLPRRAMLTDLSTSSTA
jgi:hypothetical protein